MKAIVIATGYSNTMSLINEHYPLGLIPFIDKPFLQHIVESIIKMGIKNIDFVLHHFPEKVEKFLGNGERWGSKFQFHLATDHEEPYKNLKFMDTGEEKVLLAHELYLPLLNINISDSRNTAYFYEKSWTGWGILSQNEMNAIVEMKTFLQIEEYLLGKNEKENITQSLCINSYENILNSIKKVLNKDFTDLLLKSKEIEDGVWLSRNVILPSNVQIKPPVYINENCKIGDRVKLNGNVVLGEGSIISEKTIIDNTIVFPKSYVGEALELSTAIVDKNRLINIQIGAEIEVVDDFILGSIAENTIQRFVVATLSRLTALLLFIITLPILFCSILLTLVLGQSSIKKTYVKLPTKQNVALWKTFEMSMLSSIISIHKLSPWKHLCFFFIPALWQIIRGNVSFVGVPPRTPEEIQQLPKDWQALYLNSKIGLVTEQYAAKLSLEVDDTYASEAFYAISSGLHHDFKLIFKYLLRVLKNS